eukprot:617478-Amphidinium_carterae.1
MKTTQHRWSVQLLQKCHKGLRERELAVVDHAARCGCRGRHRSIKVNYNVNACSRSSPWAERARRGSTHLSASSWHMETETKTEHNTEQRDCAHTQSSAFGFAMRSDTAGLS